MSIPFSTDKFYCFPFRLPPFASPLNIPLKCAFSVKLGQFRGFLVYYMGIVIDLNKARAIQELRSPRSKRELQRFLGRVNSLTSFISNIAGKTRVFVLVVKMKGNEQFEWSSDHKVAFERIKKYLMRPLVMLSPDLKKPFNLYISAIIRSLLARG